MSEKLKPWWRVTKYMNQVYPATEAKKRECEKWAGRGFHGQGDMFFTTEADAIAHIRQRIQMEIVQAEKALALKRNAMKRFDKKYAPKTLPNPAQDRA